MSIEGDDILETIPAYLFTEVCDMKKKEFESGIAVSREYRRIFTLVLVCFVLGQVAGGLYAAFNTASLPTSEIGFYKQTTFISCFLPMWIFCLVAYILGLGPAGLILIPCEAALRGFLFSAQIFAYYKLSEDVGLVALTAANTLQMFLSMPIFLAVCTLSIALSTKITAFISGKLLSGNLFSLKSHIIVVITVTLLIAAAASADFLLTPKLLSLAGRL
jgi:hypothetical protein